MDQARADSNLCRSLATRTEGLTVLRSPNSSSSCSSSPKGRAGTVLSAGAAVHLLFESQGQNTTLSSRKGVFGPWSCRHIATWRQSGQSISSGVKEGTLCSVGIFMEVVHNLPQFTVVWGVDVLWETIRAKYLRRPCR